jgi:large subunit ribosomal protein L5
MADETMTTEEETAATPEEQAVAEMEQETPSPKKDGPPAPPPRMLDKYRDEVSPKLQEEFGYSSPMQRPTITKVTLSMGLGDAKQDRKILEAAMEQLGIISGRKPAVRRARKSIAQFKLRDGMPVGAVVTLRRAHMWEFLDRLMSIALPRIRDFRGINPDSFDGRGNYNLGLREQTIFPEIDYDSIDAVRGMNVTITTTAKTDAEGRALLTHLGMPFREQGYTAEERAARRRRKQRGRSRK